MKDDEILIVDDHALVRRGLNYVVKEGFPDAEVTEAESAAAALEHMQQRHGHRPRTGGRAHAGPGRSRAAPRDEGRQARHARDHALDLRQRAVREACTRRRSLRLPVEGRDARGPVTGDQRGDLRQRQRAVAEGDPEPVRGARGLGRDHGPTVGAASTTSPSGSTTSSALLSEGRANREIAQHLYLSEKTVKAHLAAIFRKLGVTNRTQAAMMAVQMGVGPVPGALVHE